MAYADDLMLFGRADTTSVRILWECLTQFGDMSGLRANVLKSQMFVAGIQGLDRQRILEITGIPGGILPVRYLGIPLAAEGLRVLHYAPLLEKIAAQIGLWTASSLSYAGRLELIRSVLKGFLAIHSSMRAQHMLKFRLFRYKVVCSSRSVSPIGQSRRDSLVF